jgi:hypothetical protein
MIPSAIWRFIHRHMLCHTASMLRHRLIASASSFTLVSLAALSSSKATTAILPSGTALPIEQRVAVAVSSKQTTIWTNLRLDTAANPVGLIVPVPPGAALDHGSDAWLEALDEATAPRVFPPVGTTYVCPGTSPDPGAKGFHDTTHPLPLSAIEPAEATVLPDVPAVLNWATTHGFSISPATKAALDSMVGMRFFAERFTPNSAPFFSSTLRVVLPGSNPVLPLTLTQAGSSNLRVTGWFVGAGRATLTGSAPLKLQMSDLQWLATSQTSNYLEMRDAALFAAGPSASVTEASSHAALVQNYPLPDGKSSINSVITAYFQRAATYSDIGANSNAAACIIDATTAAQNSQNVAHACPRANLGVVDGSPSCTEAPNGMEVDPAKLRCGGQTDDLALALSDLQPANTWITRLTMIVPKDMSGQTWPITFASVAPEVDPTETAASISFAECNGMTSSSSGNGSSSGNPTTGASTSGGPVTTGNGVGGNWNSDPSSDSDMSCGCGGPAGAPVIIDENYGGAGGTGGSGGAGGGDIYYDDTTSDDCSGSTVESTDPAYSDTSSSDDCDGSTVESTETAYSDTSSSDDCEGSTSDSTYSESSSDEGIDCSGDTSETGSGGSGGSGGSTDYSETSDSSDCAVARAPSTRAKPHKRGPRASVLTLGLLAILAPLRRLTRPRRNGREQRDKLGSKRV